MARLASIQIVNQGLNEFGTSFASIAEAGDTAGMDDLELSMVGQVLTFEGLGIVSINSRYKAGTITCTIKPTPNMILYIGWLMTRLPSYATVTWRDGWPHVHCPPRDDRDHEDGPAPLVPGQCVPA
jgi:hypothetical protein